MYYYIWRDKAGKITAYNQAERNLPPPAEQVTKEEYIALGLYVPIPEPVPPIIDRLAAAYRKGVDEA